MIKSPQNEKIKHYSKLKNKKYRTLNNLFIVEGKHLVDEAIKNNVIFEVLLLVGEDNTFGDVTYVSLEVLKKLTDLATPPKVIGICNTLEEKSIRGNTLILDDIKDPGNAGSLIRSATAFNYDTVIFSTESVSIYNPKVIRATEGMLFNINIITGDLKFYINKLKEDNYYIYGTDTTSGKVLDNIEKKKHALIIGSEAEGINKDILKLSDSNLYIKMNPKCESLNAAVSGSIIMHELNK